MGLLLLLLGGVFVSAQVLDNELNNRQELSQLPTTKVMGLRSDLRE